MAQYVIRKSDYLIFFVILTKLNQQNVPFFLLFRSAGEKKLSGRKIEQFCHKISP